MDWAFQFLVEIHMSVDASQVPRSSVACGELRWREGGDRAREVQGTLLLDAGQVQIEATCWV